MTNGPSSIPNYYVPSLLAPKLEKARECIAQIDGYTTTTTDDNDNNQQQQQQTLQNNNNPKDDKHNKDTWTSLLPMNIIPIHAGQEIQLQIPKSQQHHPSLQFFLQTFEVSHRGHPTLAYNVVSKLTVKTIKDPYKHFHGKELGKLIREHKHDPSIIYHQNIIENVEVCYTGDTSIDGLVFSNHNHNHSMKSNHKLNQTYLKDAFHASIIICELTYIDPTTGNDIASQRGHLNISQIAPILISHGW
eukprot:CAMPEP_0184868258 /NCGR_PEP_ID=MMETSP0580-20130426/29730_1 /TAXON_ID=1118495 /ORGANISM="Dactyliosolen fragilissimus" /LENGTH=245 /DNA_ID=CAMNT_0027369035 /DNA_START=141 /DNA_END=875 /DNA_ORIENTATION=+